MEMRLKKTVVQCTLTFMVIRDVQNTEADYEMVREFVDTVLHDTVEPEKGVSYEHLVRMVLNPLWDYYMANLHDGYNVVVPRKGCDHE